MAKGRGSPITPVLQGVPCRLGPEPGDVWAIGGIFLSALSLSKMRQRGNRCSARVGGARRWRCEPMGASGTWDLVAEAASARAVTRGNHTPVRLFFFFFFFF